MALPPEVSYQGVLSYFSIAFVYISKVSQPQKTISKGLSASIRSLNSHIVENEMILSSLIKNFPLPV